jgi:hypothetical protein
VAKVKLKIKLSAQTKRGTFKLIALALVFILAGSMLPANAQTSNNGSGLSISPVVSEFTLKPGAADNLDITLKNITSGDVTAKAFINDFESDGTSGTPKIITDPTQHDPHSIKKFIVGLNDVPLTMGQQSKETVGLQAPPNVSAGAYYPLQGCPQRCKRAKRRRGFPVSQCRHDCAYNRTRQRKTAGSANDAPCL